MAHLHVKNGCMRTAPSRALLPRRHGGFGLIMTILWSERSPISFRTNRPRGGVESERLLPWAMASLRAQRSRHVHMYSYLAILRRLQKRMRLQLELRRLMVRSGTTLLGGSAGLTQAGWKPGPALKFSVLTSALRWTWMRGSGSFFHSRHSTWRYRND